MIKKIDHFVITTTDIEKCFSFYEKIGFISKETDGRYELFAGDFKINVHIKGEELEPKAQNVQTGSADFCFEIDEDINILKDRLSKSNIEIELGIVQRNGVKGKMKSIYLRDIDGNLIELSSYK